MNRRDILIEAVAVGRIGNLLVARPELIERREREAGRDLELLVRWQPCGLSETGGATGEQREAGGEKSFEAHEVVEKGGERGYFEGG